LGAQAADIVDTIKQDQQFSTLAKAIDSAGIAQSLQGDGPYTVFAPTDQAFDRLPKGALDALMKEGNQEQLKKLVQYHVIDGKELMAKDALGNKADVDTVSGDRLSIDGTGQMVLLVPTGLTVTRVGDEVIVERDMAAITAPAIEVGTAGGAQQQSGQQASTETDVTAQSGMPASKHQEQVLANKPATEQQQTMPQDSGMPSSPHQEQVLKGRQPGEQQAGQQAAQGDRQDTGVLREATVIEPDIRADNGVIHAIDAVLIPQSVLSVIEKSESQQGQNERSHTQQDSDKQG
jgi:uncharacterized surface protein with fasciclin (FAS1) repeats